jgi:organic radical activating enzyme
MHKSMRQSSPLAVYIHWPFCKSKCPYCDFNSHVRDSVDQERWKNALLAELEYMAAQTQAHEVKSIFFGGGTPSLMPAKTAEALINARARDYGQWQKILKLHWKRTPLPWKQTPFPILKPRVSTASRSACKRLTIKN